MYCPNCGKEIPENSLFCQYCGRRVSVAPGISTDVTTEDLQAFVGPNWNKYSPKFARFTEGGADSFKFTWHWPAFFFTFWWMLYRKLYGWALLAFFLWFIPVAGPLLLRIAWALAGNWIYFNHAKNKIREIKRQNYSPEAQRVAITAAGGTGNGFLIALAVLVSILVAAIIAAIAIPSFMSYKQKAKKMIVRENYRQAIGYVQSEMAKYSYDPANITTSA